MYGERNNLIVPGGLRITDEGMASNHHFLNLDDYQYFPEGDYELSVYARIVNQSNPKLLSTINLTLQSDEAMSLHIKRNGVLFTLNPDTRSYRTSREEGNKWIQH